MHNRNCALSILNGNTDIINNVSCSLACTKAHKIHCTPNTSLSVPNGSYPAPDGNNTSTNHGRQHITGASDEKAPVISDPETLGSSRELQELFHLYPHLRSQLRGIYQVTLEEAWIESQVQPVGRAYGKGKGKGLRRVNRGPWTQEKGFRRGLGRLRKMKDRCEEGLETGKDAEGLVRFMNLINGETTGLVPSQLPSQS